MSPAPTASRLRLLPAPKAEPPYDDERYDEVPVRGNLALAFPPRTPALIPLRLVPPAAPPPPSVPGGPPDPVRWSRQFAQALVEVLAGVRGAAQLSGHASLSVLEHLERATGRFVGRPGNAPARRPTVRSVHVFLPSHRAVEVSAVVDTGPRRRALALRLEARGDRWQCTALEIG